MSGKNAAHLDLLPKFFEKYPEALDVYYLEKQGVEKNSDGKQCSKKYNAADTFTKRLNDHLKFVEQEPKLAKLPNKSIALLGFSEGGALAPYVARDS